MQSGDAVSVLDSVFSNCPRPPVFNSYTKLDDEFVQHDKLLKSRTPDSLSREDLGTVGWNPVGCMNVEGWRYWLPTLGRIAHTTERADRGFFFGDLLAYLKNPDENREFLKLERHERIAVLDFLRKSIPFVKERLEPEVEVDYELLPVIEQWEKFSEVKSG